METVLAVVVVDGVLVIVIVMGFAAVVVEAVNPFAMVLVESEIAMPLSVTPQKTSFLFFFS